MLIIRVYHGVADHFAARVADWFLSAMMLSLGAVFWKNAAMFDQWPQVFANMARVMPQHAWAVLCILVGAIRVNALFINGTFPQFRWSPHLRFAMAVVSAVIWLQVALGLVLSGVIGLGQAFIPHLVLFDIFNAFLASSEAAEVEKARYGRRKHAT